MCTVLAQCTSKKRGKVSVSCLWKQRKEAWHVLCWQKSTEWTQDTAKRYCPAKKEGGMEGYHSICLGLLHHRRYFLDTRKGLISRRKKTWSNFLRDVRYQKLEGALWCCATAPVAVRNYRHRSCNETWRFATYGKHYEYFFKLVAELLVSTQLRWRYVTYRCSKNILFYLSLN